MLSDHERETLQELERQFVAHDPEFPRSFDVRAQRLGRKRLGMSATIAIMVVMVLCPLMLAVGSPGGALGFAAVTAMVWLAWWDSGRRRRLREESDRG